jgi:hypothetical protein
MHGCLLEALAHVLFRILLVPVGWILGTPVILIWAFFAPDEYWVNVRRYYRNVAEACLMG